MADSLSPNFDFDGGGVWTGVQDWPLIGIHATLTADNQLLTFGTDEQGMQGAQVFYDVWDYETDTHYTLPNPTGTDIFCSVSVLVPETGDILIIGGDARPLGAVNRGVKDVNVLDTEDLSLSPLPVDETGLTYARWYATAVTLSNGKILVLGGIDENGAGQGTPELYTPGGGFKTLDGAASGAIAGGWFYPRAWEASDGTVAIITNLGQGTMYRIDPSGDGSIEYYGDLPFSSGNNLPAVMFREDEFLIMARDGTLWTVDISGPAPQAEQVADLGAPRYFANMTVLANGDVAVIGGGSQTSVGNLGTLYTEAVIYSPDTNTVTVGDGEANGRLYHSTAILLPDGSVLSLGGGAPGPFTNLNGEFYYPEMLFEDGGARAEAIEILAAPELVEQRVSFDITVDDPGAVSRVTMVKSGTVTHTLNMETRFVEADFTVDAATGTVTIDPGDNSNVLTPGAWMVFVIDEDGVPSEAATVMVGLGGERYMPELGTFVTLNGTAEERAAGNEFLLTPETDGAVGSIVTNQRVDFEHDFTLSLSLYLGDRDAADGMTVLFHNDRHTSDAVGLLGGGLGAAGISNAFGIEFDTYNNYSEVSDTHSGFFRTTDSGLINIGSHRVLSSLEDGAWHDVVIVWSASTQTMSYTLDGVAMPALTTPVATQYLGGESAAYLAVTAATGGASNTQAVRITEFNGFLEGAAASISGRYFADLNGNDIEDVGEAGVAGATVWLYDANGLVTSTITDGNGAYSFGSVFQGDGYRIVFEAPETALGGGPYTFSAPNVGNAGTDSDVVSVGPAGNGSTATFDIVRGASVTDIDAGAKPAGSAPVANDDASGPIAVSSLTDADGRVVKIDGANVLQNDSDPDGDPIEIVSIAGAPVTGSGWQGWRDASAGGQIVLNTDGRVQFRDRDGTFSNLPLGEIVETSISYTISDGNGGSDNATITFIIEGEAITGQNIAPDAVDDISDVLLVSDLTDDAGAPRKINATNILLNDTDANGDALSIIEFAGAPIDGSGWQGWRDASNGGEIALNTDGRAQFRDRDGEFESLPRGEIVETSVSYRISDGNGGTSLASITFVIEGEAEQGENVAPVAEDDQNGPLLVSDLTDGAGAAVKIDGENVLLNDSDANGDRLDIVAIDGVAVTSSGWQGWRDASNGGQIVLNTDGRVQFRDTDFDFSGLAPGESITTALDYTISDGRGGTDTATITFSITDTDTLDFVDGDEGDAIV